MSKNLLIIRNRMIKPDKFTFSPRSFEEERGVDAAYIITLPGNKISEELTDRAVESCRAVDMNYRVWEGIDGTGEDILIPGNYSWIPWHLFRVPRNVYSNSQVACFLSHLSLWVHCVQYGKPIVILEHDAVMLKKIEHAKFYNSIQFLGCYEQGTGAMPQIPFIPPHASIFEGSWRSICRAHAYLIDVAVARQLIAEVIKYGMIKTLDIFIRADIFSIVQDGIYAYDLRGTSTISELDGNEKDA